MFNVFYSINQCKAHLQTYPNICVLFASSLRFFSIGLLFSWNLVLFVMFLYSFRESFQSMASYISSCCLCIMLTEALIFTAYFWGGFHFTWTTFLEGLITPSTRALILTITLLLSSASIVTGYAQCLREKSICFLYSSTALIIFNIAETFSSLQTSEFLMLEFSINDSIYGCVFFTLTGLHFSHVMVGIILLFISFWNLPTSFLENSQWAHTSFGLSVQVLPQFEYVTLLYWHFVELLWLFIQFVLYSE
uniref:Cytochrome c oxidase subunit 3 n=1 Tax=Klossiella equi TaxID=2170311 RepID=A0A3Q8TC42_9APIC|nr:cytochrome c oxidase subunit III [Klossiella equi]